MFFFDSLNFSAVTEKVSYLYLQECTIMNDTMIILQVSTVCTRLIHRLVENSYRIIHISISIIENNYVKKVNILNVM